RAPRARATQGSISAASGRCSASVRRTGARHSTASWTLWSPICERTAERPQPLEQSPPNCIGGETDSVTLPPFWEGRERSERGGVLRSGAQRRPTPDPSPQGGGELTAHVAADLALRRRQTDLL